MNPEKWSRAEAVFHLAVDLPDEQRQALLDERCQGDAELRGAVESLLAHASAATDGGTVRGIVHAAAAIWAEDESDAWVGRRIGPYRVTARIGQGGMGTVYRAVRDDDEFHKEVAIKLVKRGMDSEAILKRFRNERQILAKLEHPNIARLYDGGTTGDGLPYFVMEHIHGQPITDYCRERNTSLRERIRLFQAVCRTVQYAHQNLVVHRDLKPSNILVTESGRPKLLDFGIARLLGRGEAPHTMTMADAAAFTPEYGSPEQVRGEAVTTATDVYSLGAVLYELLAGKRAHRLQGHTPVAVERAICQAELLPPSAAAGDPATARQLEGDLDNIVLKAMHKDPALRYSGAAALAEDLHCYLAHLPVEARPDHAFYRARKFARRHRKLIAGLATVVLALAAGGLLALREAGIARHQELQVRQLARTLLFDVHDVVRDLPGATAARQTIVDTATRYLEGLRDTGRMDAELARELAAGYLRIGDLQGGIERGSTLGADGDALESYGKALEYLDRVLAADPGDRQAQVERFRLLGRISASTGRMQGAQASLPGLGQAIEEGRRLLARYPDDGALQLNHAELLVSASRWQRDALEHDRALDSAREAIRMLEALVGRGPDDDELWALLGAAESAAGMGYGAMGELQDALAHHRRAAEIAARLVERQPDSVGRRRQLMLALSHVGDVLGFPGTRNLGDAEGAAQAYVRMARIAQELHEADALDARATADYAIALMRAGTVMPAARRAEKQALLEQAVFVMERYIAESPDDSRMPPNAAYTLVQLGHLFRDNARWGEAATAYDRAIGHAEPLLASNTSAVVSFVAASGQRARIEARSGRRDAVLALAGRAIDVAQSRFDAHADPAVLGMRFLLARAWGDRAAAHALLGEPGVAAEWQARALDLWRQLEGTRGFTAQFAAEVQALQEFDPGRP